MKKVSKPVENTGFFATILQHLGLLEPTKEVDPSSPGAILASNNDVVYFMHRDEGLDALDKELLRMWHYHAAVKDNDPVARDAALHFIRTMEEFRSDWGIRQLTAVRKITNSDVGVEYEFTYYSATNKLLGYSDFHIKL